MRTITIGNIDDGVYRRLQERARGSRRSLKAEVLAILEQATRPDSSQAASRAAALRARLASRHKGDVTAAIRADRDRW